MNSITDNQNSITINQEMFEFFTNNIQKFIEYMKHDDDEACYHLYDNQFKQFIERNHLILKNTDTTLPMEEEKHKPIKTGFTITNKQKFNEINETIYNILQTYIDSLIKTFQKKKAYKQAEINRKINDQYAPMTKIRKFNCFAMFCNHKKTHGVYSESLEDWNKLCQNEGYKYWKALTDVYDEAPGFRPAPRNNKTTT